MQDKFPIMTQNKYDDPTFYANYSNMRRSIGGLEEAGEWHEFRMLLPDLKDKRILDLGCGFGWHCKYSAEQGASKVVGVDASERMLDRAREITKGMQISFLRESIEDINFGREEFDLVISSLALHYVSDFATVCRKVYEYLATNGSFVFSVEHPIFTSLAAQDWCKDSSGKRVHWPLDRYQEEGARHTRFMDIEDVVKYHRTVASYVNSLLDASFEIRRVLEPIPTEQLLSKYADMKDEVRRPMFLLIRADK